MSGTVADARSRWVRWVPWVLWVLCVLSVLWVLWVLWVLRMRFARWARWGTIVAAFAIAGVFLSRTTSDAHDLWEVAGSGTKLGQRSWTLPSQPHVEALIQRDNWLATALCVAIALGALLAHPISRFFSSPRGPRWRPVPSWQDRLAVAATVFGFVYLYWDVRENDRLLAVTRLREDAGARSRFRVSDSDAIALANLHNAKWLFLAAAVVLMLSTWGHRLPPRPRDERNENWYACDNLPGSGHPGESTDTQRRFDRTGAPRDWMPSRDRLGISVSGGGVRSASFAFGVFQVLRRDGLLEKSKYVTSVSGGGYTAVALEHENRTGVDTTVLAERTETVDRLRRRLGYLVPTTTGGIAAVTRILVGLMINLWLIYLTMFAVLRPVSWLVGAPIVQSGLRLEQPYVVDIVSPTTDPDVGPGESVWENRCGFEAAKPAPSLEIVGGELVAGGAVEFTLDHPAECVRVRAVDGSTAYWTFAVCPDEPGILAIGPSEAEVERQPSLQVGDATEMMNPPRSPDLSCKSAMGGGAGQHRSARTPVDDDDALGEMVVLDPPDLTALLSARAIGPTTSITDVLGAPDPLEVEPVTINDRRGDLDVDTRHWVFGVAILLIGLLAWAIGASAKVQRRVRRADDNTPGWRWAAKAPGALAGLAAGLLVLLFVVPWLVHSVPGWVDDGARTGPTDDHLKPFGWIPTGLPPLVAWPVLAIATVVQVYTKRKPAAEGERPKKRNAAAFARKLTNFVTNLVIGLVLILLVVFGATAIMATGALNGPFGDHAWFTREIVRWDFAWPPDLALWMIVVVGLFVTHWAVPAWSWSLGAYYRARLRWAFRNDAADAGSLIGADDAKASDKVRAGYLHGTNAELVLCTAANLLGPDRAPTGRRAVSFTASRSWVGAPELGWLSTEQYLQRLSRANQDGVSIESLMALSGAAVSPAMGKQSLGPKGSVLAVLNVRLGRWIPHPAFVNTLAPDDRWRHRPGWTYFMREVIRRYKNESHYIYLTDGGHWENLGLVEALRRGCNHIVAISAAGDGAFSHATLSEAVEIARTDLGIEIKLDDVWRMRPAVEGEPPARLPSGRQYLLQDGDYPTIGPVSEFGFTSGTFTRRGVEPPHDTGTILLIEATMVDELPLDVHAYAEGHDEFPDISTGDQFFTNRDFESYRMLGRVLTEDALASDAGQLLVARIDPVSMDQATIQRRVAARLTASTPVTVGDLAIELREPPATVLEALIVLVAQRRIVWTSMPTTLDLAWADTLPAGLVRRLLHRPSTLDDIAFRECASADNVNAVLARLRAAGVVLDSPAADGNLDLEGAARDLLTRLDEGDARRVQVDPHQPLLLQLALRDVVAIKESEFRLWQFMPRQATLTA